MIGQIVANVSNIGPPWIKRFEKNYRTSTVSTKVARIYEMCQPISLFSGDWVREIRELSIKSLPQLIILTSQYALCVTLSPQRYLAN